MFQVKAVCLLIYVGGTTLYSSDFCAVRLNIINVTGKALDATAILMDAHGAVVTTAKARAGKIEFCDFDFGEHSIRVESPGYMGNTISNVRIRYFQTQTLTAVLNRHAWGDGGTNGCAVDLRIKNQAGESIRFPTLTIKPTQATKKGDEYGGIAAAVLLDTERLFVITADGYRTAEMAFSCYEIGGYEKTIILSKN